MHLIYKLAFECLAFCYVGCEAAMTKLLSYFVCHVTQVKHHWYIFLFLCCRENEDCLVKCQSWRKLAVTGRQDDLQAGSCAVRPSKHGCEMCVRSFLFVCFFFLNIWIETHCEISCLQHLSLITHFCFSGGGAVPELIQQRAVCSPEERCAVFS